MLNINILTIIETHYKFYLFNICKSKFQYSDNLCKLECN